MPKAIHPRWVCEVCDENVHADGDLTFDYNAWHERNRAEKQWRLDYPGYTHSMKELHEFPKPVPWRVRHYECAPERSGGLYSIDVERISTWLDVAHWTAHLFGKRWFTDTNWNVLLGEAGAWTVRP